MSLRYIGPYEIIEKLNPIAYRLDMRIELEHIHNMFHISQLTKDTPNPNHTTVSEPIEVTVNLVYEEQLIQILDCRIKLLRNKQIPLVKVLWSNHTSQEATLETEEEMKARYQQLFVVILHYMVKFISFEGKAL